MDHGSRKTLTQRGRFWLEHIRRWQATDDGLTQYCRTHSLSASAFSGWRRKLFEQGWIARERPSKNHDFVELSRRQAYPSRTEGCYEIRFSNDRRLRLPAAGFKDEDVARLVAILEPPC